MMIAEELKKRALPDVLTLEDGRVADSPELWRERRAEILNLLSREIYGFLPPPPDRVVSAVKQADDRAFAGKAVQTLVELRFPTPKGEFSFPVNLMLPRKVTPAPLFLHIAFRRDIPDRYYPVEEIIDGGYATASFCYEDVVPDRDDGFTEGLAVMYATGKRAPDEWGKISMWAWAASRVMDYLQTLEAVDRKRIAVVGHSRLGKTALWCAAQDERFCMGISNDSGCSGAAIARENKGERVENIVGNFPYWFCENYRQYAGHEEKLPFDQHFLLAAIAPRPVYVASALDDAWADPRSEFLSCAAASAVYERLGLKGFVTRDEYPKPGTVLHEGKIGYHFREGTHFLSRYDWQRFMEFRNRHEK